MSCRKLNLQESYPQLSNGTLRAATEGCFVAYHRKSDRFQAAVPYWSWPSLEKQGEVADGVLVIIDGQTPIIVSPTDTQLLWSKNAVLFNTPISRGDYVSVFSDYSGKNRTSVIMENDEAYFGVNDGSWPDDYAVPWCLNYDRTHQADNGQLIGFGNGEWWLPSIGELKEIFNRQNAINLCLSVIKGANKLSTQHMWSSTESSEDGAWFIHMSSGIIDAWTNKASGSARLNTRCITSYK